MSEVVDHHIAHLRRAFGAAFAGVGALSAVVNFSDPPGRLQIAQGRWLLWVFVALAVLDLITVMPAYRAMLAGPRRVFAVNGNAEALLRAHAFAHVVAVARVAAVAALGLLVFLMTGDRDWYWAFAAVAAVGMWILWPLKRQAKALLAGDTTPPS